MRYRLKALRPDGSVVSLTLSAASPHDAGLQAASQGLSVLALRKDGRTLPAFGAGRTVAFPLALFSQELKVLLTAGITLVETLETLAEREHRPAVRGILARLVELLREGRSFSAAMETMPEAFPALYTASVRASETSGTIAEALERYLAYQSQIDQVRKKIISASVYPLLLLSFGGLVLFFLLGYVIPKFSQIYQDHDASISLASRMLLNCGQFIAAHGPAILGTAAVLVAGLWAWLRQPAAREKIAAGLRRIPGVGERFHIFQMARLYRTLSMLLRGGIPAVQALDMAAGILESGLKRNLSLARTTVSEGFPLSGAFQRHGLATPVALRLIRVGEQTGSLGEMLGRAAEFHEEELGRDIDVFVRLFEPALMMFIGLVIGSVVVLMYLPIFELASAIG